MKDSTNTINLIVQKLINRELQETEFRTGIHSDSGQRHGGHLTDWIVKVLKGTKSIPFLHRKRVVLGQPRNEAMKAKYGLSGAQNLSNAPKGPNETEDAGDSWDGESDFATEAEGDRT